MEAKYSGQKLSQTPQVRQVLENPHFCSFCILYTYLRIQVLSNIGGKGNSFKIGVQSDAEEFLVVLIENLY